MESARSTQAHRLVVPPAIARGGTRRLWIWGLIAVAATAAAYGVRSFASREQNGPRYRTSNVERRSVTSVVEAAGQLDVQSRVEVPAPAAGPLVEIAIEIGAAVEAGQVLARLDARPARASLANARATLAAAGGHLAEAEATLRGVEDARVRTEKLAAKGLASDGDLASARASEDRAKAALATARAEKARAAEAVAAGDTEIGLRTIRAPVGGVVLAAPRWVGVVAAPEKGPLFVIGAPIDVLRLEVSVGEADIGSIRPKQKALFNVPAFPSRELEAEVEQIRIDAGKKDGAVTFPVLLRASNADRSLMPGMTATARIRVAEVQSALVVREAALRFTPDGAPPAAPRSRVWRSSDGIHLTAVAVVAGVSDGAYTEVNPVDVADLPPGTPVVLGVATAEDAGSPGISLGGKK